MVSFKYKNTEFYDRRKKGFENLKQLDKIFNQKTVPISRNSNLSPESPGNLPKLRALVNSKDSIKLSISSNYEDIDRLDKILTTIGEKIKFNELKFDSTKDEKSMNIFRLFLLILFEDFAIINSTAEELNKKIGLIALDLSINNLNEYKHDGNKNYSFWEEIGEKHKCLLQPVLEYNCTSGLVETLDNWSKASVQKVNLERRNSSLVKELDEIEKQLNAVNKQTIQEDKETVNNQIDEELDLKRTRWETVMRSIEHGIIWIEAKVKQTNLSEIEILNHCLFFSAYFLYSFRLNFKMRIQFIKEFSNRLKISIDVDLCEFLEWSEEEHSFLKQFLFEDRQMIENFAALSLIKSPILLIDKDGETTNLIKELNQLEKKNIFNERQLVTAKANSWDLQKKIENALTEGQVLLIENVEDFVDPYLESNILNNKLKREDTLYTCIQNNPEIDLESAKKVIAELLQEFGLMTGPDGKIADLIINKIIRGLDNEAIDSNSFNKKVRIYGAIEISDILIINKTAILKLEQNVRPLIDGYLKTETVSNQTVKKDISYYSLNFFNLEKLMDFNMEKDLLLKSELFCHHFWLKQELFILGNSSRYFATKIKEIRQKYKNIKIVQGCFENICPDDWH
ncbi:unnamed protein product [Rotaria magnacalcarata]|uniref:Dynein heavy chain ATP-binding dynein motor region domain-containing protein n=1 Tax=Rotaria magnacalcarata TaxID=392030 RepID=A0A816U0G1_9BILA|nr:unnamed protein product [Rotaria magnacalcarata]CAF4161769.1 unnamed protein product [Rotaria magnacalcarata]